MNVGLKNFIVKLNGQDYTNAVKHNDLIVNGKISNRLKRSLDSSNGNLGKHWIILISEYESGYLGYSILSFGLDKMISKISVSAWMEKYREREHLARVYKNYLPIKDLLDFLPSPIANYSFINRPLLFIPKNIKFLEVTTDKIKNTNLLKDIHSKISYKVRVDDNIFIERIEKELGKLLE